MNVRLQFTNTLVKKSPNRYFSIASATQCPKPIVWCIWPHTTIIYIFRSDIKYANKLPAERQCWIIQKRMGRCDPRPNKTLLIIGWAMKAMICINGVQYGKGLL